MGQSKSKSVWSEEAKFKAISIWGHQIEEHLQIARQILKENKIAMTPEESNNMQTLENQWGKISKDPALLLKNNDIIGKTRNIKQEVKDELSAKGISCEPDLLGHMIGELDYVENAIINDNMSNL